MASTEQEIREEQPPPRAWRAAAAADGDALRQRPVGAEEPAYRLLGHQRELAERRLNALRAGVLVLLTSAALAYAPSIPAALNRANVVVLVPLALWTAAQYLLFYRKPRLPDWLAVANPVVDITAVTAILALYGLSGYAELALKSPLFLAYFVILAGRPVASATSKAALVATLAVLQYAALSAFFQTTGRVGVVVSPVALGPGAVSLLDEGAKALLLAVAGWICTYATAWHERMATSYYRESRDREQLETKLAQAQLQSLRLQLNPHFLFNTLNGITALIGVDALAAERMVSGLSDLLRLSLRNAGEQEVPLERELEVLRHYLDIQLIRFEDRLTVDMDVDPAAMRGLVPNLLLQPLVENAIRHGIAPRAAPGRVLVRAHRGNGILRLVVADDGVGPRGSQPPVEGTGLGNTRARLQHLYGPHHRYSAGPGERGGFVVEVEVPYREEG
ncbi:MAG TPA: histidine kinase [Gemmatimonadaceae bacterium]|nr:histidine kinase [Gemmatimonadaceae bacterium]